MQDDHKADGLHQCSGLVDSSSFWYSFGIAENETFRGVSLMAVGERH